MEVNKEDSSIVHIKRFWRFVMENHKTSFFFPTDILYNDRFWWNEDLNGNYANLVKILNDSISAWKSKKWKPLLLAYFCFFFSIQPYKLHFLLIYYHSVGGHRHYKWNTQIFAQSKSVYHCLGHSIEIFSREPPHSCHLQFSQKIGAYGQISQFKPTQVPWLNFLGNRVGLIDGLARSCKMGLLSAV